MTVNRIIHPNRAVVTVKVQIHLSFQFITNSWTSTLHQALSLCFEFQPWIQGLKMNVKTEKQPSNGSTFLSCQQHFFLIETNGKSNDGM